MFDSNGCGFCVGDEFVSEIFGLDSRLKAGGFAVGQFVHCTVIEKVGDEIVACELRSRVDGPAFLWESSDTLTGRAWLVYAGDVDGNGYLTEKDRKAALQVVGSFR